MERLVVRVDRKWSRFAIRVSLGRRSAGFGSRFINFVQASGGSGRGGCTFLSGLGRMVHLLPYPLQHQIARDRIVEAFSKLPTVPDEQFLIW